MVDDGSTDNSGKICDKYAENNEKFKVIHQKNGGLAVARQAGLNAAMGEYIIVCDSDDWVEPQMYRKLYDKAKETNADIVLCGYFLEYKDGRSVPFQIIFKETDGVVDKFDLLKRGAGGSWRQLVKKSLFDNTKSSYEPGIDLSEDSLIFYKLMRGNPKVVQIHENLYHYRRQYRGNTYTNNIKMSHIYQLRYTYEWFKKNYTDPVYAPLIYQKALDLVFACLRVDILDKGYLFSFIKSELPWKTIFKHEFTAKSAVVSSLKLFPFIFTKLIVKILYPIFYR